MYRRPPPLTDNNGRSDSLDIPAVARMWSCHPDTVYRAIRAGRLPAFRVGRVFRVRREDAEAWRNNSAVDVYIAAIVARADELTGEQRQRLHEVIAR